MMREVTLLGVLDQFLEKHFIALLVSRGMPWMDELYCLSFCLLPLTSSNKYFWLPGECPRVLV